MPVSRTLILNSGASIPTVGLGVFQSQVGDETYHAVRSALKLGYRHVDTAQIYGNEADVGRAVADSGLQRSEVFVTTKLWRAEWGAARAREAIDSSLRKLGMAYVDLLLLHCPGDPDLRAETWAVLEEAVKKGQAKSIGVSNFGIPHLERLMKSATITPAVNQIELSPFNQRVDVVQHCQSQGIALQAYSPLAKASKLGDPRVVALAAKRGITPAQLLIRWSLQKGFIPLPKSVNPERQATNLDVFGFELSLEDVVELDKLEEGLVTGWDPILNDPV